MSSKNSPSSIHIICAYAPTLICEDQVKDYFYDCLSNTLRKFPASDTIVLLGDFNARVGNDHASWPDAIGSYGIGKTNSNGQRVLELCSQEGLTITNTRFKQNHSRRVTWRHPRSGHWHQLDLTMIKKRDIGTVKSSRSYHSADGDTDHSLVLTVIDLPKKRKPCNQKKHPRINRANMKSPEHAEMLSRKFSEKMNNSMPNSLEDTWTHMKEALLEAGKDSFGTDIPPSEDWIAENLDILEPLMSTKNNAHRRYKQLATPNSLADLKSAQRNLQKASRHCANLYWNSLCNKIQEASDAENLRLLYEGLNKAIGPSSKKLCPLKTKEGMIITDSSKQMQR